MNETKGKVAAAVIMLYGFAFCAMSIGEQYVEKEQSVVSVSMAVLLFALPAVGTFLRVNGARIWMGLYFVGIALYVLALPFIVRHPRWDRYPFIVAVVSLPVYLVFFYPPLKEYTRSRDAGSNRKGMELSEDSQQPPPDV